MIGPARVDMTSGFRRLWNLMRHRGADLHVSRNPVMETLTFAAYDAGETFALSAYGGERPSMPVFAYRAAERKIARFQTCKIQSKMQADLKRFMRAHRQALGMPMNKELLRALTHETRSAR